MCILETFRCSHVARLNRVHKFRGPHIPTISGHDPMWQLWPSSSSGLSSGRYHFHKRCDQHLYYCSTVHTQYSSPLIMDHESWFIELHQPVLMPFLQAVEIRSDMKLWSYCATSPDLTRYWTFWHFFSETHPKQTQCDVLLCAPWHVGMSGFVKIPVVSNVDWDGICGNTMASSSMVIA